MASKRFGFGNNSILFEGHFNGQALLGASISFNGDGDDIVLGLHVYPFGGFIMIRSIFFRRLYRMFNIKTILFGRNFGFGLMKGGVFTISCGTYDKNDEARDLVYLDLAELLGAEIYSEETIETGKMEIELPDKIYRATYRTFFSHWKRSFGFQNSMRRISIKMKDPVKMPSGEDVFGVTMPYPEGQDIVDLKIAFINSISLERRKREIALKNKKK